MSPSEIGIVLNRIEEKLDAYLERLTAAESRVVAHELVAGAILAVLTLGVGAWAVVGAK